MCGVVPEKDYKDTNLSKVLHINKLFKNNPGETFTSYLTSERPFKPQEMIYHSKYP